MSSKSLGFLRFNYTKDSVLIEQLYEDYFYIMLNLILVKDISLYIKQNNGLNMDKEIFFQNMKYLIIAHYDKYEQEYLCLKESRLNVANQLSEKDLTSGFYK